MRIPRTILLTAALAVVPIATTPAFATAIPGQPTLTIRNADKPPPLPGLPGTNGQRGHCMQHKGFGPLQHEPGQQPAGPKDKQQPGPNDKQQPQKDQMHSARDCGFAHFPGFGRHHWGRPMTPEQRSCMAKKGFGPGHDDMNRSDQHQWPSQKDMDKRRQDFGKAAKDCGVQAPHGFHHGPMGPMGHEGSAGQGGNGGKPA